MITVHINPNIENQVVYGTALADGFMQHGERVNLTSDVRAHGDVHCIIGPWYAFREYRNHPGVLYLDRACWDHPAYTCINWLAGGEKVWSWGLCGTARNHPQLKPRKTEGRRAIVLCDYNEPSYQYENRLRPHFSHITIRKHPAQMGTCGHQPPSLVEQLADHQFAIGKRTSALVTAAIEGLNVFCVDPYSPVYPVACPVPSLSVASRAAWLRDLSWHHWTPDEIAAGQAWDYFRVLASKSAVAVYN